MVKYLQAVRARPDDQVVETISRLLMEAKAGRITGLSYVSLQNGTDFKVNVVGRSRNNFLLALGSAQALSEAVSKLFG